MHFCCEYELNLRKPTHMVPLHSHKWSLHCNATNLTSDGINSATPHSCMILVTHREQNGTKQSKHKCRSTLVSENRSTFDYLKIQIIQLGLQLSVSYSDLQILHFRCILPKRKTQLKYRVHESTVRKQSPRKLFYMLRTLSGIEITGETTTVDPRISCFIIDRFSNEAKDRV